MSQPLAQERVVLDSSVLLGNQRGRLIAAAELRYYMAFLEQLDRRRIRKEADRVDRRPGEPRRMQPG